jgi:peptidyl-dipeptidase A
MMGTLSGEPSWLATIAGVPEEDLRPDLDALTARRWADRLVFTRWALVVFRFERELYADPDCEDLNSVWWDVVQRLQLVERPSDTDERDWAAKIHIATAPVYYHNFVLGHLIAAQLRDYLETHITRGPFYESEVAGRYLLDTVFGPGAREDWRDTVQRATGEPPEPAAFREFSHLERPTLGIRTPAVVPTG